MKEITVYKKKELKKAYKQGYGEITIKGNLAKNIYKSRKIFKNKIALGTLSVIGVTAIFSKGMTAIAVAPLAAVTGTEVVALIAVCVIGIGFLIALFKDYEEIEMSTTNIILRKKSKV